MRTGTRALARLAYVVALGALSGPVLAQESAQPLVDPTSITFEHDGENVTGFAAYVTAEGSPPLRIDLGALRSTNGKVTARLPTLPTGEYRIEIAAYNEAGESARVPAEPDRFQITGRSSAAAATEHDHGSHAAGALPPQNTPQPAPEQKKKKEEEKEKKGIFGRVYRGIVGSDEGGK